MAEESNVLSKHEAANVLRKHWCDQNVKERTDTLRRQLKLAEANLERLHLEVSILNRHRHDNSSGHAMVGLDGHAVNPPRRDVRNDIEDENQPF